MKNILMMSDSYKYSHPNQYPANMVSMYDYGEARSGKVYPNTVVFGIQYYIQEYLAKPFKKKHIKQAVKFAKAHGIPFDKKGWKYILKQYGGYLPVEIKAIPEGTVVPTGHPIFTVESTDERVPWVAGYLETLMMKIWYPSNIATRSFYVKKTIEKYWAESVEDGEAQFGINFAYHNFGDRGSSSVESAGIGGVAHLTQFMGTDNFNSLVFADKYYDSRDIGFSIPATEHSTTTSWGKEFEDDMILNHIEFNKSSAVIAAVLDSYDYLAMVERVTSGEFKEKIESGEYPKFVMRPDSGDPIEMINATLDIMVKNEIESFVNKKGFIEFKNYGIIWGDGIDDVVIENILKAVTSRGFSANIVAFGSGGWLMQQHDRDTQGWAVKCSEITVEEGSPIETGVEHEGKYEMVWESFHVTRPVFKDPITAPNKKSKKGKVTTYFNPATKTYFVDVVGADFDNGSYDMLRTVYNTGSVYCDDTIEEIRARSI